MSVFYLSHNQQHAGSRLSAASLANLNAQHWRVAR